MTANIDHRPDRFTVTSNSEQPQGTAERHSGDEYSNQE